MGFIICCLDLSYLCNDQ